MKEAEIVVLIFTFATTAVCALAGLIIFLRPPKRINPIYGYRTPRSSSSPQAWRFANRLFGEVFFISTLIGMLVAAALYVCRYAAGLNIPFEVFVAYYPLSLAVEITISIATTETRLKKFIKALPTTDLDA